MGNTNNQSTKHQFSSSNSATMADSSPNPSNNGGGDATPPPPPTAATTSAAVKSPGLPTVQLRPPEPPKNLRGLNKPKCIQCGNVARSRCPFQSCKNCCSKAQNPCHIHVLKQNATLADRGATTSSATQQQQQQQQQPSEVPPSGPSAKVSSVRQLSSTFAQFNNVHIPLRSRKPVTKKDALAINAWRFAKLKEYKERNIEAENESFDRYMLNISLLEEIFDVNSERPNKDVIPSSSANSGDKTEVLSEMKVILRSNPVKIDKFRKRIQQTVDQGLRKLPKYDSGDAAIDLSDEAVTDPSPKAAKNWWAGKTSALSELNDRLNKARNEDDLKLCIQLKSKIRGQQKTSYQKRTDSTETMKERPASNGLPAKQESEISLLKLWRNTEIEQDDLNSMDTYFSSLEEIEDL